MTLLLLFDNVARFSELSGRLVLLHQVLWTAAALFDSASVSTMSVVEAHMLHVAVDIWIFLVDHLLHHVRLDRTCEPSKQRV